MKTSISFLAVILSIMVLAGCKSCPCNKTVETAPVAAVVSAPIPAAPVAAAPAAPAPVEAEEAKIPAAVLK